MKLLAPNGKPSNLNPEQYKLVRTKAFKDWFGDWDNDPANASKVVDENGEPLIVYRGDRNDYNAFDKSHSQYGMFYFTDKYDVAKTYTVDVFLSDIINKNVYQGRVKEYFLNIRNLYVDKFPKKQERINSGSILKNSYDPLIVIDEYLDYHSNIYVAFEPTQIKLADGTNTTFDGNNPDIRFKSGGEVPEGAKLLPLTMGKFAIVDAEDFDWLNEYKWRTGVDRSRDGKIVNYYGQRTIYLGGKTPNTKANTKQGSRHQQVVTLGKQIMGIPLNRDLRVDYIDGNKLNNQKSNLRVATISEINYGATSSRDKKKLTSKYIGVSYRFVPEKKIYDKRTNSYYVRNATGYWRVNIQDGKGRKYDKNFPYTDVGEIKAAKWYDSMAKLIHGEFAVLNFPDDKFMSGGNVLLAPNGEPSNLNPEQYKLVRTPEFKAWFGDWEKNAKIQYAGFGYTGYKKGKNSSLAIDENGEPKVFYHQTPVGNYKKLIKLGIINLDLEYAGGKSDKLLPIGFYLKPNSEDIFKTKKYYVQVPFFLNFRSVETFDDRKEILEYYKRVSEYRQIELTDKIKITDYFKSEGIDCIRIRKDFDAWESSFTETFLVLDNKNIKLADGTNTTFDSNNPDIRFRDGGGVNSKFNGGEIKKLKQKIKDLDNWFQNNTYGTAGYKYWDEKAAEAESIRRILYELTGDAYGETQKEKDKRKEKPSDRLLNAEYNHPSELPKKVYEYISLQGNLLTDNASDAVRWSRIIGTENDDRYPKGEMTIYRAVKFGDYIREGDWVTTDEEYAINHNDMYFGGKGKILQESVDGRDILFSPTGNKEEAIYAPMEFSKPFSYYKKFESGGKNVEYSKGGITEEDKKETYKRWKDLVNMSASELKRFMDSDEGKIAGLSKKEADKLGIHYGRESAKWILKMKDTPVKEWTPTMWEWAKRQISFNSRMRGNRGKLYDEKGRKTRKHLSLLIWGHNPEKYESGGAVLSEILTTDEVENMLGRKISVWDDSVVMIGNVKYKKLYLLPEYERVI